MTFVYNNNIVQSQNYIDLSINNPKTEPANNPPNKSESFYKQIFDYLIEQGVIDKIGRSLSNLDAPHLKKAQLDRIQELLCKPFIIVGKNNSFKISITLKDLFDLLKLDRIEIVGGTVFWILGEEYMREVCSILNIPEHLIPADFFAEFSKLAADIDTRVWNIKDPSTYKKFVYLYLATKLPDIFNQPFEVTEKVILKNGLSNFHTHRDEETQDHFGIISFGNRTDFSLDLLFIDKLKRKNLFKHDALKIVISRESIKDEFTASLNTNGGAVLESLILKLTKTVDADEIENINEAGASKLISHLTKGYRYTSAALENMLVATFLKTYNFMLLKKLIGSHFPDTPLASSVICFNACTILPKNLILNISKLILEEEKCESLSLTHFNKVLMHVNVADIDAEKAKILFEGITGYFQILGFLNKHLIAHESDEFSILQTTIKDEPYFQFRFNQSKNPLYIAVKDDLSAGLANFKLIANQKSLLEALTLFSTHLLNIPDHLKISEIILSDSTTLPILTQYAFEFIESDLLSLQEMGFYLLCEAGIAEKNSTYLSFLIMKLPELLKNKTLISVEKSLYLSLIKYWLSIDQKYSLIIHSKEIEAFYEKLEGHDENLFWITFSKLEIPKVSHYIVNKKNFDLQTNCQLFENFKNHDLLCALKLLKAIVEDPSSNFLQCHKYFETLVALYANLKNKLLEIRDLHLIAEVTELIIDKMAPYKSPPPQDERNVFIAIAKKIVLLDFAKGVKIITKLEEKKGCVKGYRHLFKDTTTDDKTKAIQQLTTNPLDSKANVIMIVERMAQFLVPVAIDLDPELLPVIAKEIIALLERFFKAKKPNLEKLKATLSPHLSWILEALLKQSKNSENRQELIQFYFKIAEIVNPKIIYTENLIAGLITILKTHFTNDSTQSEFVKNQLDNLKNRNEETITKEELELYDQLIAHFLKYSQTKSASEFIIKTLNAYKAQNIPLTAAILEVCSEAINQFISQNQFGQLLSFLENQERIFPDNPMPEASKKWKSVIGSFDQKQNMKKMELLIKKEVLLKNDETMVKLANEIAISFLNNRNHFKDKKNHPLESIFKLIKGYQLTDLKLIKSLKDILLFLKDKNLTETALSVLQQIETDATPLFTPLSLVNSDKVILFFKNKEEILVNFKESNVEKKELILEFISGFLSCKAISQQQMDNALIFFNEQLRHCGSLTVTMQSEIDFKYCRTYLAVEKPDMIVIWKKIVFLGWQVRTKEEIQEILEFFNKAIIYSRKSGLPEATLERELCQFFESIADKIIPEQMMPHFNFLSDNPSKKLLAVAIAYAAAIVKDCPFESAEKLSKPYLQFKIELKRIIEVCFILTDLSALDLLLSNKLLTQKEARYFSGKISHITLNHPSCYKDVITIKELLDQYITINFSQQDEDPQFQQNNLLRALDHLTSLVFIHDDFISYIATLNKFIVPIKDAANIYASIKGITAFKDRVIITEKVYQFYYHLMQSVTDKITLHKNNLTHSMIDLATINISLIENLTPFSSKAEEVISLALDFSYLISILPNQEDRDSALKKLQSQVKSLKDHDFFQKVKSIDGIRNSVQLVALARLPLEWFKDIAPLGTAKFILRMINKIMDNDTVSSNKVAFQYYALHSELINYYFKEESLALFDRLKATNFGTWNS